MQVKTLEELKAENAQAEEESTPVTPDDVEEIEVEAVEEESEEVVEAGESERQSEEEESTEAWMQADEQVSDDSDDVKFTDHDVAAAKRNLKAKLEKKHDKVVEELKAKIEALESGRVTGVNESVSDSKMPTLEDVDFDEAKLQQATAKWYADQLNAKAQEITAQQASEQQIKAAQRKLDDAVESHYERASKLVQESGISAEKYQEAGVNLMQAIDDVLPGNGEMVTNSLIANLGEGSEKVTYYLGRNPAELRKLQNMLAEDSSGIKASMHLGALKAKFSTKPQIKSSAKPPAKKVEGDGGPINLSNYQKRYKKAKDSGDPQKAFDIRQEARKQGVDVKKW